MNEARAISLGTNPETLNIVKNENGPLFQQQMLDNKLCTHQRSYNSTYANASKIQTQELQTNTPCFHNKLFDSS